MRTINDRLTGRKLELEIRSLTAQIDYNSRLAAKLELEIEALTVQKSQSEEARKKLDAEVKVLQSQVGGFGSFARIFWPVISALLTLIIGLTAAIFTYRTQDAGVNQKTREIFLSALHDATDESKGNDTRIAGLWALGSYWNNPTSEYKLTAANVLAAALITGSDYEKPEDSAGKQIVRLTAAEVIGTIPNCDADFVVANHVSQGQALAFFLYGVAQSHTLGAISRLEVYLLAERARMKQAKQDTASIDQKLIAVRVAIEKNRSCLSGVNMQNHDLTAIELSKAELSYSSLSGADVRKATLTLADLYRADLDKISNWSDALIDGANIKAVQNAPLGFRDWALDAGAVEMELSAWHAWRNSDGPRPKNWSTWRQAGFPVDSRGVPTL